MEDDIAVLVSSEFFETGHAVLSCVDCHGGVNEAASRAEAHEGMEPLPSSTYGDSICAACHESIATNFANTLHADTLGVSGPEDSLVLARADESTLEVVREGMAANCNSCHVSGCGDCHVSRPQFNGGGFVSGHVFNKTPNTILNCVACHGSRIEKEYTGKGESGKAELHADAHWNPGGMQCVDCHTQDWIHNEDQTYKARYDNMSAPECTDCHIVDDAFLAIGYHEKHATPDAEAYLQCQVCHAQDYNNCIQCHAAKDDQGLPYFVTDESYFDLNIGRNYEQSESKPWDYIVVRHVPVFDGTFDYYGEDALPNIAAAPTFKYATPHSIARVTRQSESCSTCHLSDDIFLTQDDLDRFSPEEQEANKDVIVDR